ncbi:MAG TPA: hypothetical protein VIU61_05695, partial [Kofleriaceae bacterium]
VTRSRRIGQVNLVTWSKLLGIASVAGLITGQYYYARERLGIARGAGPRSPRQLLLFLAPAFTACCCYVISWAMFGLETPLYLALLVWSAVTLGRYVDEPSRWRLVWAGSVCGAFSITRPEAPMMLAAIGLALLWTMRGTWRERVIRLAIGVAPAVGLFASYSIFRRAYFGLWFPHTYYSKGGDGWNKLGLQQLVGDGASTFEVLLVTIGIVLAGLAIWRRRDAIILATTAATIFFVAKVEIDWMPNVRFWLPLWVMLPLAWAWAADAVWPAANVLPMWKRHARRAATVLAVLVPLGTMVHQASVDMRYSIFSYRSRGSKSWTKGKSRALWHDTWLCLNREWPAYIAKQDRLNMGMITQVFRLIESDARPLDETWFVGPDIGMIGYLTPVNVWEPPGLFTPDVRLHGKELKTRRHLSPQLLHAAFDRPVVMTELFDGLWVNAIKKDPVLSKRLEPTADWFYVRERGKPKPSHEQIVARYRFAQGKFPSGYFVMLMHGSALGAELDRRAKIVESLAR